MGKMVNGLHVEYSPVNVAWFLMWRDSVLRIFPTKREAQQAMETLNGQSELAADYYRKIGK